MSYARKFTPSLINNALVVQLPFEGFNNMPIRKSHKSMAPGTQGFSSAQHLLAYYIRKTIPTIISPREIAPQA
jgi:hypothetical protein